MRNDSLCGSTIGPMMAAKAGIKTIDIGGPMLAMHSIRETCGVIDLLYYRKLFAVFFTSYYDLAEPLLTQHACDALVALFQPTGASATAAAALPKASSRKRWWSSSMW